MEFSRPNCPETPDTIGQPDAEYRDADNHTAAADSDPPA
jgi:hypothetical protein